VTAATASTSWLSGYSINFQLQRQMHAPFCCGKLRLGYSVTLSLSLSLSSKQALDVVERERYQLGWSRVAAEVTIIWTMLAGYTVILA